MRKLKSDTSGLDRRQIIKGGLVLGGGLIIGLRLTPRAAAEMTAAGELMPNAFVRIAPDGSITVISKHIEFGQGTYTSLATVLAEELDADWSQVGVESAPADVEKYKNLAFGVQGTGGSTAMANSWMQMRQAGATARALQVSAAAETWSVPAGEITVEKSVVTHTASGRSATFGELVDKAATLELPAEVTLKDPSEFTLIGHETLPRVDVPAKTRGEAQFTFDFALPGMLTAVIERPPVFGATVAKFDAAAARKVPGVVEIVEIPQGIAVLAKGFRAARNGRRACRSTGMTARPRNGARTRSSRSIGNYSTNPGSRREMTAMPRRHLPAPRRSSRPTTSSPTSSTPRWSHSTAPSG
jgi:isoquinoline 1-oxidoreductase beta subunit